MVRTQQAQDWMQFVLKVGVGGAIGLFLVYKLTTSYDAKLDATLAAATSTQSLLQQHAGGTAQVTSTLEKLVNLQLQQCANAAGRDDDKRTACFNSLTGQPQR